MLYTGDEMGFMIKWDISKLIEKLNTIRPQDDGVGGKSSHQAKSTFHLTENDAASKLQFSSDDIILVKRWKAHQDLINQVTFVPELENGIIATCSFDCNVYMWRKEDCRQVGSLVLGTGLSKASVQSEAERKKYNKVWQIKIDKYPRYKEDRDEAESMLKESADINYHTMFMKGNKADIEAL